MRLQGWRACIAPVLFRSPQHGEWVSTKQTTHSKGSAGVMAAAAAAARTGDAAWRCWRHGHRALIPFLRLESLPIAICQPTWRAKVPLLLVAHWHTSFLGS